MVTMSQTDSSFFKLRVAMDTILRCQRKYAFNMIVVQVAELHEKAEDLARALCNRAERA